MTSPSSLILVHDNERGFVEKFLCTLVGYIHMNILIQKNFVPMCNHSVEFDGFYGAEIYGDPVKLIC